MANIAAVLKSEIARVARKEIRAEVSSLRKSSSQHRSTIAALRREIDSLRKQLRARGPARAEPEADGDDAAGVRRRFSAPRLAKHRHSLGLSAQAYGKLVGVSGQSIYKWEAGEVRPRATQIEALASVRGLGKREAAARLEQLAAAEAPRRARAKPRGSRR